ncbi:hypothetical protein BDV97DRAFT_376385 [Delphinella strobiligena]|nr:hypothetical protein BDV97DRAFT_376385 [Delphinella strobiligena]
MASSSAPSPSYQYPTGPPPPYSHPAPLNGSRTPPEARRSSGDDQEKTKQSLPSIHEALGVEQPHSYPGPPAPPTSQHQQQQPPQPYSVAPQTSYAAPAPPSPPVSRRPFAMEPPPPPIPATGYAPAHRSPGSQYRPEMSPRMQQDHYERSRPVYISAPPPPPPVLPQRNGYSADHHPAPYHQPYAAPEPSQVAERMPAHPGSMPPPPTPFSHGYSSYQRPPYAAPAPYAAPPPPSSSVYQPSVSQPAPSHAEPRPAIMDPNRPIYSESVKRHLDMYDFEAALNEINEGSTCMLDFSRQLGARMHQTQRSGPVSGTLPSLHEIDDLMARSRGTLDSLGRMREVIVAQQAACYQQAHEQQFKAQDETKRDSVHQVDDSKVGGFAGPEAKKRRGRAAPPGRCHSCQRAETPEWRRGPDGARTLCNACGLHYAKLTRKQGAQKAAIGSSNLRPKAGASDTSE